MGQILSSLPSAGSLRERLRDEDGSHGQKSATSKESGFKIEEYSGRNAADESESFSVIEVLLRVVVTKV
jgi:hypothetical protein